MKSLAIVVPCYNEEPILRETTDRLLGLLDDLQTSCRISSDSCLLYVDDGSSDLTWRGILDAREKDNRVRGIKLSRNFGHQNALLAGLLAATQDMVVSIDADLQDDVSAISEMVNLCNGGKDVIFGVRQNRSTDTWFKRNTALLFYRLLKLMGVNLVFNHADFRLMSRRAIESLREFGEANLFLRGIVPAIGLPSATVTYVRASRTAGETKYSLRKMLSLAANGVTSFSVLPLRMISALGIAIFAASLLLTMWVVWVRLFSPDVVPGWASSVLPMYFLGGVQLLSIGILGEYIARIYVETKRRPRFVIETTT